MEIKTRQISIVLALIVMARRSSCTKSNGGIFQRILTFPVSFNIYIVNIYINIYRVQYIYKEKK